MAKDSENYQIAIEFAREKGIILPPLEWLKAPEKIPEKVKEKLEQIPIHEIHPLNLFRLHWKNDPSSHGFGSVNVWEVPPSITGSGARIVGLLGTTFPSQTLKSGPAYTALVRKIVNGQFNPRENKAIWLSMGKFARGGAFTAALMGCLSVAILQKGFEEEQPDWFEALQGEVVIDPNPKDTIREIYQYVKMIQKDRPELVLLDHFAEEGNYLYHYHVTGPALEEAIKTNLLDYDIFSGLVLSTGSAGTLASGDYLKELFPSFPIAVLEPLQSPTLLMNGYGFHRIPGIGKNRVPWIHNVRNTDMVMAVDDQDCLNIFRMFQEPEGKEYLASQGLSNADIACLGSLGISSIANLLGAIKFSKYYELKPRNVIFTVFYDSAELYKHILTGFQNKEYSREEGVHYFHSALLGQTVDHIRELTYQEKRRIHNLKYFTWVEQEGRDIKELEAQWYDYPDYWQKIQSLQVRLDQKIQEFNEESGVLASL